MSYLCSDRLQMRTAQTEARAVHGVKGGEEKKSMNECLNLSAPVRENFCGQVIIFWIKIIGWEKE